MVEQAAKKGAQIICLQELYRTVYFPQYKDANRDAYAETIPGKSTEVFLRLQRNIKSSLSYLSLKKISEGQFHNSAVVINVDGKLLPTYRKVHIPQDPLFYEKNYLKRVREGTKYTRQPMATFAVLICYDQWFPEAARAVKLAGAELVFYRQLSVLSRVKNKKKATGMMLGDSHARTCHSK